MKSHVLSAAKTKYILFACMTLLLCFFALSSNAEHQDGWRNALTISFDETHAYEIAYDDVLRDFYMARDGRAFWLASGKDGTIRAAVLLKALEESWTHGLNPAHYNVDVIRAFLDGMSGADHDPAGIELLIAASAIQYGRDLSGMRVDPAAIRQKAEYWRQPAAPDEILAHITKPRDLAKALDTLYPQGNHYRALRDELVRLSVADDNFDHLLPLDFGGYYVFRPGQAHPDIKALRRVLGAENIESAVYDDDLAAMVMAFQKENGLTPDALIGSQTRSALNLTNRGRIEQIIVNLERQRWLEQERPDRYILVNIPQQVLWAVENGQVAHEMKVIVGARGRNTNDFKTDITGVRFNPTWTVPNSIKVRDIWPRAQKDPYYLVDSQIEIFHGYGREAVTIDPLSVDWNNVSRREVMGMRFVQRPGNHNALGRIRVLMPNEYNIYLHDTNMPDLFGQGHRALSSGCVRLSDPEAIARFVMKGQPNWSEERMTDILATRRMTDIHIDNPFPAYIVYNTIWMDEQQELVFGYDLYGWDERLLKALAEMDGYHIPAPPAPQVAELAVTAQGVAYTR